MRPQLLCDAADSVREQSCAGSFSFACRRLRVTSNAVNPQINSNAAEPAPTIPPIRAEWSSGDCVTAGIMNTAVASEDVLDSVLPIAIGAEDWSTVTQN
jgi:hypothetical protein